MKKCLLFFLFFLIGMMILSAHDYWILPSPSYSSLNKKIEIHLGGGHIFPQSELALKDQFVFQPFIMFNKQKILLDTQIQNNLRIGYFTPSKPGIHLIGYSVKKPSMKKPLCWCKSIIYVGVKRQEKEFDYKIGSGLEIVPKTSLWNIKKGDELKFKVYYQDREVRANGCLIRKKHKGIYFYPQADNMIQIKIKKEGLYLLRAEYQGMNCSLTFKVKLI